MNNNDITSKDQVLKLLEAGVDPRSCNMVEFDGHLYLHNLLDKKTQNSLPTEELIQKILCEFPSADIQAQKNFMERHNICPLWTSAKLMNLIPDRQEQDISLTRGGYDPLTPPADDEKYNSDVFFCLYKYNNEAKNLRIEKTFGGDSYIEAVIKMVVTWMTSFKPMIE